MEEFVEKVSNSSGKDIFISIFEFAAIGIIVSNQHGDILLANQYAEKLFGYESKELESRRIEDLVPREIREKHIQHREKYNGNPHVRTMGNNLDLQGVKKNGDRFYVEVSLGYFKSEANTYIMAFVYDVSSQKEAELEILERNKAIEQYLAEIKTLNENLEEQIKNRTKALLETLQHLELSKKELEKALSKEKELGELKSRFVSMASHEFRTPLSTILSSIQLLSKYAQQSEHQEKIEKHTQRIIGSVNHLNDILEEFLSVGKLEEGKISANFSDSNLEECLQQVSAEMQNIAKTQQRITFLHEGYNIFNTDCSILKKILINLLSNAIKFSPENSLIEIKSILQDNQLSIQIMDKGIGISQEDQKHLFERFFRAENAINIKGTGLGLHIVGKFVEMLHGSIHIDSQLGEGTTITLTFSQ